VEEYESHIFMNPGLSTLHSDETTVVPSKVYIRGLDNFNPSEVKSYVAEHASQTRLERIEWIDDSSANLLFGSETAAQEAIVALAAFEIGDASQLPPRQLVPAKSFSGKPDASLQIRFATTADKKEEGAAARSKFYLFNPAYDPEERRRRDGNRPRYREQDGSGGRYRRDRYRERDHRERGDDRLHREDIEEFDVNLYDDDSESRAKRAEPQRSAKRYAGSSGDELTSEHRAQRQNEGKELFPNRQPRRREGISRGRSASPIRTLDDDQDMIGRSRPRSRSRSRSRSRLRSHDRERSRARDASARNRLKAVALKDRITSQNKAKELFPTKMSSGGAATGKAQMDQVNETQVLSTGMSCLSIRGERRCFKL
jgi:hypothetical protein